MWYNIMDLKKIMLRPASTTKAVRDKVKTEHAKVEKTLDESLSSLNTLLDETIKAVNGQE